MIPVSPARGPILAPWPSRIHDDGPTLRRGRLVSKRQLLRTLVSRWYKAQGASGSASHRQLPSTVYLLPFISHNAFLSSFRHPPCCHHLRHHRVRLVPRRLHYSARERARGPNHQPWSVLPRRPPLHPRLNQPSRRCYPVSACAHHPRWLRLQPELHVQRPARVLML
jgi:hypothetical protein